MEIAEQQSGAVTVLRPSGALTGEAGPMLRDRVSHLLPSTTGRLLLDLSEVPFLDSRGIESLLDTSDVFGSMGLTLKLCSANLTVMEVLRLTGNADVFEFFIDSNVGVRSFL